MKKLREIFKKNAKEAPVQSRVELDQKAVEGAEKAVREYRRVFERLAEYDRK